MQNDFKKGDVVEFCDQQYYVIENNGSKGVVNPFGENFYVSDFYWEFGGEVTKFVRNPTQKELENIG